MEEFVSFNETHRFLQKIIIIKIKIKRRSDGELRERLLRGPFSFIIFCANSKEDHFDLDLEEVNLGL